MHLGYLWVGCHSYCYAALGNDSQDAAVSWPLIRFGPSGGGRTLSLVRLRTHAPSVTTSPLRRTDPPDRQRTRLPALALGLPLPIGRATPCQGISSRCRAAQRVGLMTHLMTWPLAFREYPCDHRLTMASSGRVGPVFLGAYGKMRIVVELADACLQKSQIASGEPRFRATAPEGIDLTDRGRCHRQTEA